MADQDLSAINSKNDEKKSKTRITDYVIDLLYCIGILQ